MPQTIKMFREPDLQLSSRSEREWENEIAKLLKKEGIREDKVVVKAWGKRFHNDRNNDQKLSEFEKNLKVEWQAELRSFDIRPLQMLK